MAEIAESAASGFRFLDSRQQRIFEKLGLIGGAPAASFRDACHILDGTLGLDTATHLVAHALREIEGAIRQVLVPLSDDDASEREHGQEGKHRIEIELALAALEIPIDHDIAKLWNGISGDFSRRAHRSGLAAPRPVDENFLDFWDRALTVFDYVLDSFSAHYLRAHDAIDQLVEEDRPSRGHAKKLRHSIPNNLVALSYFFDNLSDPAWLQPLRAEGFFQMPPTPEVTDDGVRTPPWPASRYLARMAVHEPELVREIISEMPTTENVRVHEDLVAAAHAMPTDTAVTLVGEIESWLEGPQRRQLLAEKTSALASRLVSDGHQEAGFDLMQSVLQVRPPERDPDAEGTDD